MNKLMRRTKNKKGFTLIELLVVLAILAVIALIAVPNFIGVQDQAKDKSDLVTIDTVQKAMELMVVAEDLATGTTNNELCIINDSGVIKATANPHAKVDIDMLNKYLTNNTEGFQGGHAAVTFKVDADGKVTYTPAP